MILGIDATRANKPQKTGVEWYSYYLIRALAAEPSQHTIRLYFNSPPEPGLKNLGPHVEYRVLHWPFKYLWTQARLSWEMLINPPDLLFIPAQIIPVLHPTKTVTTIHDVAYKPYPESYRWRSRFYLDFAARLAKRLPLILTVSEFSKKEIVKYYGIPESHISVIPLGFRHETTLPASIVATKFNIKEPYLLYVGRLERKKNVHSIIESFNLVKREDWGTRFRLVLVGVKGYGWMQIENVIKRSPYRDDIKIVGWVTEAEKHTLIAGATALILLSAYEGFGLPLLEAMANQTPAITSDQAALPEVAGTAAIIVPRGNNTAVCNAVHNLVFDAAMREGIVREGMRRIKQYSWERTARMTLEALDALYKRRI
ncbi:MAG: hypothetical protein A2677_03190 [Candidatus Komeilibacteria bacterium RIFCSPHIGHO2_01_FULL_52_14]|uniref:Glycosyltransferase subfamily 4-like N-terminal domain-containing protein n=1 Tax=Candidatus Komeilibacteria bacterium RIFCSPHIGHO2_01_FULL_52_14 TaxID=1798549 RepID=A0A1G2BNN7_9BACT|nr:MAG: hypothetical protein A2677_03190 [Candidatus Komeilibacteria bacterium RIFCSPHIGHO2_01_FULL_52_14]